MSDLIGDQAIVYDKLNNFISQDTNKIFRLLGSAGTGKTTIITKFILDIINKENNKIYFLASTNKAVKVLKEKTNFLENKNVEFQTIDKFLNCIERINKFGDIYFSPKGIKKIYINKTNFYINDTNDITFLNKVRNDKDIYTNEYKYCPKEFLNFLNKKDIIIIDECSMLNDDKWNLIKYFSNCKIIIIGDYYQLQPISESDNKDSIVFSEEIDNEFNYEMNTIVRTDDSKISKLYQITRSLIDKHLSYADVYNILKNADVNRTGLKEVIIRKIKEYIENDKDFVILSYKNYSVNEFNKIINSVLEDTKIKKYGYFLNTKYIMKNHYNKLLTNNTEFEIVDVIKDGNLYYVNIKTENNEDITITIYEKDEHEKFVSNNMSKINKLNKYYTSKSNIEKNKLKQYALEIIDDDSTILTNYIDVIEGAILKIQQNIRCCICKNEEIFSLGYSLTIHKSQGSDWKNLILNLRDIYDTKPITLETKARLLYVACSRASQDILFYI